MPLCVPSRKTTFNENSELNQKCTPNRFSIRSVSLRTCKKNFDMSFLCGWKNTNVDSSRARQNQHFFSDLQLGLLCRKVKLGDNTNLSKYFLEQEKRVLRRSASHVIHWIIQCIYTVLHCIYTGYTVTFAKNVSAKCKYTGLFPVY